MQTFLCATLLLLLVSRSIMVSGDVKSITVSDWGCIDGRTIEKYTLRNKAGQTVEVVTYGATIVSLWTPDRNDNLADVVLGFDSVEGYTSNRKQYFGATIGRVANRVANGGFTLNGKTYRLARNAGNHSLHGGSNGWSHKIWEAVVRNDRLILFLLSEDGDEGYPGATTASVVFRLTDDGELRIEMKVFTNKPTPINLTNHSYFNLAGHNSNASELYKHRFELNADRWTVTDASSIPTGEIRPVDGSPMDLRTPTILGDVIDKVQGDGYDYNFCLPADDAGKNDSLVARVVHPPSGRYLEVRSNQPGVQFYTANYLPERVEDGAGIRGKRGSVYFKHGAFCLETQNYPDAVNHENFPNSVLEPGQVYRHVVTYKFGFEA